MRQAIKEADKASSKTTGFIIWRAKEILAEAGYQGAVPSDRTLYRLFGTLARGRHVTGSASTRRSLAGRPAGTFGSLAAAAPGEVVQVDSTPLDVLVLLNDGVPGRVEMTGMIDVATRVVPAAVLRPTTKAVDASVLLARALAPEPVRPGWPEALKMARSVLPYERLLAIDDRLQQAAARPVIVPDTIVIDHGPCSSRRRSGPPAGTWASPSSPSTWAAGRRRATSSATSGPSPRCSPSSPPATSAAAPTGGPGTSRTSRCGPWPSSRSSWTSGCCSG
jgi:hypothetical protein